MMLDVRSQGRGTLKQIKNQQLEFSNPEYSTPRHLRGQLA
jgi:hypothetical protein